MSIGKEAAGRAAVDFIKEGMKVGLGTGSTVAYFLEHLGDKCRKGFAIQAVASSVRTEQLALSLGIPLMEGGLTGELDITVDGADEIDGKKNLIKGGGGALLREKMVAYHSREMIVIIDSTKYSEKLSISPLPVEITTFGHAATIKKIEALGFDLRLRLQEGRVPYTTDNGNFIIDIQLAGGPISVSLLDDLLHRIPGVVETGYFSEYADKVVVGYPDGSVAYMG